MMNSVLTCIHIMFSKMPANVANDFVSLIFIVSDRVGGGGGQLGQHRER